MNGELFHVHYNFNAFPIKTSKLPITCILKYNQSRLDKTTLEKTGWSSFVILVLWGHSNQDHVQG